MTKVVLRSNCEFFQLIDNELAAFGFGDIPIRTTVELRSVVLRFHKNDDFDLFIIVAATHLFAQQWVNDSLGVACHAENRHQEKG